MTLTKEQILAIQCAYADLVGALQARNQGDPNAHDWDEHWYSIIDLENNFDFIEPAKIEDKHAT